MIVVVGTAAICLEAAAVLALLAPERAAPEDIAGVAALFAPGPLLVLLLWCLLAGQAARLRGWRWWGRALLLGSLATAGSAAAVMLASQDLEHFVAYGAFEASDVLRVYAALWLRGLLLGWVSLALPLLFPAVLWLLDRLCGHRL